MRRYAAGRLAVQRSQPSGNFASRAIYAARRIETGEMKINAKGLEAAFDVLWPAQEWNGEESLCRAATEAAITAYLSAVSPPDNGEGKSEPVAWYTKGIDGRMFQATDRRGDAEAWDEIGIIVTPLYAHPASQPVPDNGGWLPVDENTKGPVTVCRFGDEDRQWLPMTAYRGPAGQWWRPASRDGLPYEPTHWQPLPAPPAERYGE